MATHKSTWKGRERKAARIYGTLRKPGSGSQGRADQTRSDSMHEDLYIETKTRPTCATRSLYDDTRAKALKEGKVPVLMLAAKYRAGFLVVIHSDDLQKFAAIVLKKGGEDGESSERQD